MIHNTERVFIHSTLQGLIEPVREIHRRRRSLDTVAKGDPNDFLTEADLSVQRRVVAEIAAHFPEDACLAEEGAMEAVGDPAPSRCWVLDPIDGTQNFVRGLFPAFGVSLAFAVDGDVVAAGVALPIPGDLFLAERGAGAFRNGVPLHVSDVPTLDLARVDVDFGYPERRAGILAAASDIILRAGGVRSHCSAVIGLCSVATGDMDAYVHIGLHPWDFAASELILEEAGGRTSCFDGSPVALFRPGAGFVGTNAHLHQEVLDTLSLS